MEREWSIVMSSLSETWSCFRADNDGELGKMLLLLFHNKPSWFIWGLCGVAGFSLSLCVYTGAEDNPGDTASLVFQLTATAFKSFSWGSRGSKLNNSLQTAQASSSGTILSTSCSSLCQCAKQTSTKELMLIDENTKRLFDSGWEVGFTTLWCDGLLVLSQSTLGKTKQNES